MKACIQGRIVWGLALFIIAGNCSLAQINVRSQRSKRERPSQVISWEPPAFPGLALMDARPTVPRMMVPSIYLAGSKVVLEETSLGGLQARFLGKVGHSGDAGYALSWLCVTGMSHEGRWIIWLESGELDGGTVGSFQWLSISRDARVDSRCGRIAGLMRSVTLPHRLQLGMSAQSLLKTLGKPTARRGNTLVYLHEHQSMIHKMPYTTDNAVAVIQSKGAVRQIAVSQTTTD